MRHARHAAFLAAALLAAPLAADDPKKNWPQWRGPLASGVAPLGNPPTEWSESSNIRWKVRIPGRGHATPIVWGNRIYLSTATPAGEADEANESGGGRGPFMADALQDRPDRPRRRRPGAEPPTQALRFVVLALDRATGKTVWERTVHEGVPLSGTHPDGTYASNSPTTDGQRIYASFGSYGIHCLDMDGKVLWQKDLGDMQTRMDFGEGASPTLYGDTLVVNWDHEGDDFIVALDAKSGDFRWRVQRDEPTTWSTPLVVEVDGKPQVITSGTKRIRSYDLASGEPIWDCGGLTENVIPSPVFTDGMAILMSGFRGAATKAIKLSGAKGDVSGAVVWTYDKNTPYVPSPLLYGDTLYFLDNNKPVLTCLNPRTGEKHFGPERLEGMQSVYASPVGASDHVYVAGRDGKVIVLKRGPKMEVLATNTLSDGFDASPAIAGDELFLRGYEHLYCVARN